MSFEQDTVIFDEMKIVRKKLLLVKKIKKKLNLITQQLIDLKDAEQRKKRIAILKKVLDGTNDNPIDIAVGIPRSRSNSIKKSKLTKNQSEKYIRQQFGYDGSQQHGYNDRNKNDDNNPYTRCLFLKLYLFIILFFYKALQKRLRIK